MSLRYNGAKGCNQSRDAVETDEIAVSQRGNEIIEKDLPEGGADGFTGEAPSRSFCGEAGANSRSGCEGASPVNNLNSFHPKLR